MNCNRHPVVRIKKIVNGGYGLARLEDGKTVFVRHSLPGERVSISIVEQQKRLDYARTMEVHESSSHRVEAPCPYYKRCGGCDFQHIEYREQCRLKEQILAELLTGSASEAVKNSTSLIKEIIASPKSYNYRQRTRLKIDGSGNPGFNQFRSHTIVPVEHCPLALDSINQCLSLLIIKDDFKKLAAVSNEMEILLDPLAETVCLIFHLDRQARPTDRNRARSLCQNIDNLGRIFFSAEQFALEGPYGSEEDQKNRRIGMQFPGQPPLTMFWEVQGFSQVNPIQNINLINLVVRLSEVCSTDRILDLYCGMGNFALPLARHGAEVHGIEAQGSAIRSAKFNGEHNKITTISFEKNDVAAGCRSLIHEGKTFDTIICDPPRRGMAELIPLVTKLAENKIIYISCDPATLCRDLDDLTRDGFRIKMLQPIDMFPQTHHLETVVLLEKSNQFDRKY